MFIKNLHLIFIVWPLFVNRDLIFLNFAERRAGRFLLRLGGVYRKGSKLEKGEILWVKNRNANLLDGFCLFKYTVFDFDLPSETKIPDVRFSLSIRVSIYSPRPPECRGPPECRFLEKSILAPWFGLFGSKNPWHTFYRH